ncbi:hypothetical protein JN403_04825 [Pseudomonas sp. 15A4]|uniref:hypothetical protein n=1 Tax=Pseudomonas sp. 15A4 TaxID=2804761 RepID=UPI001967DAB1|nr:hypothetical protein [Pseudomonas sp. 15A4]QSB20319.1 hypothetical protein JN403_04825 [Pseudomonas sp. 15A4]
MTFNYPACALATLFSIGTLNAYATTLDSRDKPFNEYSWVTTHNSYEKINQNLKEMPAQLNDGVRGFMLDLYVEGSNPRPEERIKVCHQKLACYGPLSAHLKNEFLPFLQKNPGEVVTLFLETYVKREHLQEVFNTLPELSSVSFDPANFAANQWPTINQMAARNNRLILFTDKREVAGDYWVQGKRSRSCLIRIGLCRTSGTRWGTLPAALKELTTGLAPRAGTGCRSTPKRLPARRASNGKGCSS